MREQNDHAEQNEQAESQDEPDTEESDAPVAKKPRARKAPAKAPGEKAPAKPRAARKKTVKAAPRMVARWAVCDGGLKRLAVFEYRDRAGADAKLAEMKERKAGTTYVLQLVKDPYDPPVAAV